MDSMAKARGDFTDILIKRQTLSPDQLEEAQNIQKQTGAKLPDAIVKLGYASSEEVMSAIAEFHGLQFVDLAELTIPPSVIDRKSTRLNSSHPSISYAVFC